MDLKYEEAFNHGYKQRLFDIKPMTISCIVQVELDPKTPEGKYLQDLVASDWKKQLDALKKEKEKIFLDAINATEKNIYSNFAKEIAQKDPKTKQPKYPTIENWLDAKAKDPNTNMSINNALSTIKTTIEKKAQEIYDKAAESVDKKFKTKVGEKKKKAAVKITGYVSLTVVTGALGILAAGAGFALTAMTFGVGAVTFVAIAPLALTALATTAGSIKAIYDILTKELPSMKKEQGNLRKALIELEDAIDYEQRKHAKVDQNLKLGKLEKIKLALNDINGKKKSVIKHAELLDAYNNRMRQKIEESQGKIDTMEKQLLEMEENIDMFEKSVAKDIKKTRDQINTAKYGIKKGRDLLESTSKTLAEVLSGLEKLEELEQIKGLKDKIGALNRYLDNDDLQSTAVGLLELGSAAATATAIVGKLISRLVA